MIELPKKVAVCFMSGDKDIAENQSNIIDKSKLGFELEEYFRHERNSFLCQTFSQMINETIDDTESEFMIFINPKTIICTDDIEFIVNKLCSGYCFASLFGFAFFGMTKELVRKIGMLDESFLAGEYEDNDYLIRMKLFGKMVYWGQDWSKYEYFKSKCDPNRGSSLTMFWRKWRWKENRLISSNASKKTKSISRRHSKEREDISSSWRGFEESHGEGGIWEMTVCEIEETNMSEHLVEANLNIGINFKDENFFIEMLSEVDTAISYFLVTKNDGDSGRVPINMNLVYSNHWRSLPVSEKEIELRLYHDGNLIYLNQIGEGEEIRLSFRIPSSILK
jgi:hypothetical protein